MKENKDSELVKKTCKLCGSCIVANCFILTFSPAQCLQEDVRICHLLFSAFDVVAKYWAYLLHIIAKYETLLHTNASSHLFVNL